MKFDKLLKRWSEDIENRRGFSNKIKEELVAKCPDVFRRYDVKKAFLFGSATAQKADKNSDIDLLVQPLSKNKYWSLRFDLEQVIGHPIDLYTQDDDPVFVKKILSRGEIIYEI